MIRFDRAAPGEGMILYHRIENGKAYLEFQFFLKENTMAEAGANLQNYFADICVYDMSDRLALEIVYPLQEEELAKGMLLHPHLWRGVSDPYLYLVKVTIWNREQPSVSLDVLERQMPLRTFSELTNKGWFLNGEMWKVQAVTYHPACQEKEVGWQERIYKNLQRIKEMGANTICLNQLQNVDDVTRLCDKMGLLVWYGEEIKGIPQMEELLSAKAVPTDLYYYYKAAWSKEPFVYILRQSLKCQENGNFALTVYSNQEKVALYVEGVLFEFQMGAPEFHFEDIPATKYPLQLTVEAGECRVSYTAYL